MTHPFTLAIDEDPFTFEMRCVSDDELAVATLGWFVGRWQWGLA